MDAVITVTYNGQSRNIVLDGKELSEVTQSDGSTHRYLNTASRDFIAGLVEVALIDLTKED